MSATTPALGPILRELRQARGLSLMELGYRTECNHSHLSRIENGRVGAGISLLARIADALTLTTEERRRVIAAVEAAGFAFDGEVPA